VSDGSLDVSFGSEDGIVTTDRQLVIRGISDLGDAETRSGELSGMVRIGRSMGWRGRASVGTQPNMGG
jgi:hypothetical protein